MIVAQDRGESASRRPGLNGQKGEGFFFDQPVTSILSYSMSQTNHTRQPGDRTDFPIL
jgi:hypothetical protein